MVVFNFLTFSGGDGVVILDYLMFADGGDWVGKHWHCYADVTHVHKVKEYSKGRLNFLILNIDLHSSKLVV